MTTIDKVDWVLSQSGRRKQVRFLLRLTVILTFFFRIMVQKLISNSKKSNYKDLKVSYIHNLKKTIFQGMPEYADFLLEKMSAASASLRDYLPLEMCNLEVNHLDFEFIAYNLIFMYENMMIFSMKTKDKAR